MSDENNYIPEIDPGDVEACADSPAVGYGYAKQSGSGLVHWNEYAQGDSLDSHADTEHYRLTSPTDATILALLNSSTLSYITGTYFDSLVHSGLLVLLTPEQQAYAAQVNKEGYVVDLPGYARLKSCQYLYLSSAIEAFLIHNYRLPTVIYNTLLHDGIILKKA